MDFFKIKERRPAKGVVEIYPDFKVRRFNDLMLRGGAFYAIWDEAKGMWSTDEYDVQRLVDNELWAYFDKRKSEVDASMSVLTLEDFSSGSWSKFKKFAKDAPDCFHPLDERLTFSNTDVKKTDYISHRLPYPLQEGSIDAYDKLMSTLYDPAEREKLEWALGAVISGKARDIQKFIVLYGEQGAGKSTFLNIAQQLFEGYYTTFEAKALTSSGNIFATEVFRNNPLVAIQHDGDLSRIEDNSRLNSIISHEEMVLNEKFKSSYTARINSFLLMATNRPVKITDAKSGIIRRLIDVKPSGRKLPAKEYFSLKKQIAFELGAIAWHCLGIFENLGANYYASYKPLDMIFQTDVFFNFVENCYDDFSHCEGVSLSRAYDLYKAYCTDSNVEFKLPRYKFREELKNYFREFYDVTRVDGKQIRSWYTGFQTDKFISARPEEKPATSAQGDWLNLTETKSPLDILLADFPAQYGNTEETPTYKWTNVKTFLRDLDTTKLHYVRPDDNHIVIDFDLKDSSGEKSKKLNLEAARHWPPTYAEYSKGGQGLHLHYIFDGDVKMLSRLYSQDVEIKVFTGNSSLRRKLTLCNALPVAHISAGLPLKEAKKVVNFDVIRSEKELRNRIKQNLRKEVHPDTSSSINFIKEILDQAYSSGLEYDVRDLRKAIFDFAANSTHQADRCCKVVMTMKFASDPKDTAAPQSDGDLIFFDVEVFPNLFLVNYKEIGEGKPVIRLINPSSSDLENLIRQRLVGFNNRKYDNHILYARYALAYTNEELYSLSTKLISDHTDKGVYGFQEAYNLSYTDIYDFSSKKQSLKKFEIELGIHHQELDIPWDKPVPEELWTKVAEYCDNDVLATEAVWNARQADFVAREILADLAGMTVNDTTNTLTRKIIFGDDRAPQSQFNYRFMGDESAVDMNHIFPNELYLDPFTQFDAQNRPIFPGYTFEGGKSIYRGEEVGEGGYVYSEPGMYTNLALLDIASMHPSSIIAEELFGPKYTQRFKELKDARIFIKHGDLDSARAILDGKLAPYLEDEKKIADLPQALKIAINAVYGQTSAKYNNAFRDIRNRDNIVAKRGALFMVNLKHEVQARGFTVAHIKTDSIKIPNATPQIISFVQAYGKLYGYDFEHEATYERMALVNDAVYIARYATQEQCEALYGAKYVQSGKDICKDNKKHPGEWTATGEQFAHSCVFKTLFSREPLIFDDYCEAKSVQTHMVLDYNENLPDVHIFEEELKRRQKGAAASSKRAYLEATDLTDEELQDKIETGHDYHFVGRTGLFCPVIAGAGGGLLMRVKDGKYYSVGGTKDFRWMEAETIKLLGMEDKIDKRYSAQLIDAAVENISKYGDFEWFTSDLPVGAHISKDWSPVPCGDMKYQTCFDCMKFLEGKCCLEQTVGGGDFLGDCKREQDRAL